MISPATCLPWRCPGGCCPTETGTNMTVATVHAPGRPQLVMQSGLAAQHSGNLLTSHNFNRSSQCRMQIWWAASERVTWCSITESSQCSVRCVLTALTDRSDGHSRQDTLTTHNSHRKRSVLFRTNWVYSRRTRCVQGNGNILFIFWVCRSKNATTPPDNGTQFA